MLILHNQIEKLTNRLQLTKYAHQNINRNFFSSIWNVLKHTYVYNINKIVNPCSRLSTARGQRQLHTLAVIKWRHLANDITTLGESRPPCSSSIMQARNTQKPKWPWRLTLICNRLPDVVEVHLRAEFYHAKCSSSWVIVFTEKQKKNICDNAENNTAVASAGSNKSLNE